MVTPDLPFHMVEQGAYAAGNSPMLIVFSYRGRPRVDYQTPLSSRAAQTIANFLGGDDNATARQGENPMTARLLVAPERASVVRFTLDTLPKRPLVAAVASGLRPGGLAAPSWDSLLIKMGDGAPRGGEAKGTEVAVRGHPGACQ
jgi:hypothetical protein